MLEAGRGEEVGWQGSGEEKGKGESRGSEGLTLMDAQQQNKFIRNTIADTHVYAECCVQRLFHAVSQTLLAVSLT